MPVPVPVPVPLPALNDPVLGVSRVLGTAAFLDVEVCDVDCEGLLIIAASGVTLDRFEAGEEDGEAEEEDSPAVDVEEPLCGVGGVSACGEMRDRQTDGGAGRFSARPTPLHTNPIESGPENTFSTPNRKQTKRFMIFDPKKRGGRGFSDIFDPPTPPAPPSRKWVSHGGGLGGSRPKTHWGMCLLDKIMILQGVKQTIHRLEEGYANRPKNGGYVVFSPIRGPAWF